jgi:pentatricopeptide repeat protein
VSPDTTSFSTAIACCGQAEQWERVWSLWGDLTAREVEPDEASVNGAIVACESTGRRAEALSIYGEAVRNGLGATLEVDESTLELDVSNLPSAVALVAVVFALDKFARDTKLLSDRPFALVNGLLRIVAGTWRDSGVESIEYMLGSPEYAALGVAQDDSNPGSLLIMPAGLEAWIWREWNDEEAKAVRAYLGEPAREESLEKLTVKDLREMLRQRELPVSGKKAELIQRLRESDALNSRGERLRAIEPL